MDNIAPVRLLLAEDNRAHQQLLLRVLSRGHPEALVTTVDTGAEFLRALECCRFDCALIDYQLPDYRADELLKASEDRLAGCPVLVLSSNESQTVVIASMRSGAADFVPKHLAMEGTELWSRIEHAIGIGTDKRHERRKTERRTRYLIHLSETDPLTGLSNRRYIDQCLEAGRWSNERRLNLGCAIVDLDHFKDVNDTFGHAAGDAVLRENARIIRRNCTDSDVTTRWGGEEFLVIKPTATLLELWLWAEKLRMAIEAAAIDADGTRLHVTRAWAWCITRRTPLTWTF